MRMFPCPHTGSFFAFYNISIFIFSCIDQSYITFIFFRFFIDQIENTFCPCQCHNNRVKLLRHLHKRLCKALGELQVRSHNAKCDTANSCNRKNTTQNCCQYKLQVTDISDHRSHHVTVFVCLCRTFKKCFIQCIKLLFRLLFVIKNFNYSLSVHTLFNKSCYVCQRHLLTDKIFTTFGTDLSCYGKHHKDNQHCQDCQQRA